jgi:hypothetical protein
MNMNYTKIIVWSAAIFTIICFGTFYFINQSGAIDPMGSTTTTKTSGYDVEKGLEDIAKVAAPAVQAYLDQDKAESTNSRNIRLSQYFSGDSPVYKRELQFPNSTINKTTAKVKSVESTESETSLINLTVKTENTLYSSGYKNTSSNIYWVNMSKTSDGTYVAYDIGELEP